MIALNLTSLKGQKREQIKRMSPDKAAHTLLALAEAVDKSKPKGQDGDASSIAAGMTKPIFSINGYLISPMIPPMAAPRLLLENGIDFPRWFK
jgi:hypothetical protein